MIEHLPKFRRVNCECVIGLPINIWKVVALILLFPSEFVEQSTTKKTKNKNDIAFKISEKKHH